MSLQYELRMAWVARFDTVDPSSYGFFLLGGHTFFEDDGSEPCFTKLAEMFLMSDLLKLCMFWNFLPLFPAPLQEEGRVSYLSIKLPFFVNPNYGFHS